MTARIFRRMMDEINKAKHVPCPNDKAGLLSRLTYWWFNPMVELALKRKLNVEDLPAAPANFSIENLCGSLERKWDKLKPETNTLRRNDLCKIVLKEYFWSHALNTASACLVLFTRLSSIILLQELLIWNSINVKYAIASLVGIVLLNIVDCVDVSWSVFNAWTTSLKMRVALTMIIYKKMLWLKVRNLPANFMENILNLFSNDVSALNERFRIMPGVIAAPLALVANAVYMWWVIGWYSLLGNFYLVIYLYIQILTGYILISIKKKLAVAKGEQIKLIVNILRGIKLIKMYAWEKHFEKLVLFSRKKEIFFINKLLHHRIVSSVMFHINGRLSFVLILIPYIFQGNKITPDILFPIFNCCNLLRVYLILTMTGSITVITDQYVALNRIQNFLQHCEKCNEKTSREIRTKKKISVIVENVSQLLLRGEKISDPKNISLNVKQGDRVAIIGKVGAGKTLLLMNILGEHNLYEGSIKMTGKVAYVPQEPWIFPGSVQENILFGLPFDKERFYSALDACALLEDIGNFPRGIETFVGENGVRLSGGQKSRINLARAIYSDADIYLLDDIFSAVDVGVGKHLFYNCIQVYLKDKIVFLTIHQLQFIQELERIIHIDNGYTLMEKFNNMDSTVKELEDLSILMDENDLKITEPDDANITANDFEQKPQLVSFKTHWTYFFGESSNLLIFLCCLLTILYPSLGCLADFYLKILSGGKQFPEDSCLQDHIGAIFPAVCEPKIFNFFNFFCFLGAITGSVISTVAALFVVGHLLKKSSKRLYNQLLNCTLRAKPVCFQTQPIGNFINCFTVDIGIINFNLPVSMIETIGYIGSFMTSLILASIFNLWLIIPCAVLLICCTTLAVIGTNISRNFLRLESSTRSSIYSHVTTTLTGLPVIHSQHKEKFMLNKFRGILNTHCSSGYCTAIATCWTSSKVLINSAFNLIIMKLIVEIFVNEMSSETIGIIMSSIFMILSTSVFSFVEIQQAEDQMHAVENVLNFSKLESEALLKIDSKTLLPKCWPTKGDIVLKNVNGFYSKDEMVLKDISLTIHDREKIGIVGRTGAGKSSLFACLLRWIEPDGDIKIDGVSISDIGLHDLRSNISIITQDPVLFTGTIKSNLDPFNCFQDEDLYQALEDVQILHVIKNMPGGLSATILDSSASLSAGEKQLLCLARIILRKNRILLLDEATANIDKRTDTLIQKIIREKFQHCTVLTIAHRLETVIDSDRVLVMENGKVVEFDEPYKLLMERKGHLFNLLQSTGKFNEELLLKVAKEACENRDHPA